MKPILAALLIVILPACGQQDSDSHAESSPPAAFAPAPETPVAAPEASPVTAATEPDPAPSFEATASAPAPASPRPPAVPVAPATAPRADAPAPLAVPAPADPAAGRQTYQQACAFCHDKGVAGAPKLGDAAAWSARTAQGKETLYASALHGKGAMPAKGGNSSLSDDAVKAAVDFLVAGSR